MITIKWNKKDWEVKDITFSDKRKLHMLNAMCFQGEKINQENYYNLLEKWNLSSYQVAWASWFKGIIFGIIIMLLCGCGTYQQVPVDKCCDTDVVYLDEIEGDSVNIFTSLDFNTITLDFRPRFSINHSWYWGSSYGYWGHRPLWMDFDFYYGYNNYYSYHL